jgi:hypothetical protein
VLVLSFYFRNWDLLSEPPLWLITWTFSWCWWFRWWWWRLQVWWWHIPGATKNTIVPIFCTPLSFSFSVDLITQTVYPPERIWEKGKKISVFLVVLRKPLKHQVKEFNWNQYLHQNRKVTDFWTVFVIKTSLSIWKLNKRAHEYYIINEMKRWDERNGGCHCPAWNSHQAPPQ